MVGFRPKKLLGHPKALRIIQYPNEKRKSMAKETGFRSVRTHLCHYS